jgi:uncharacterized protein (DUF305 family)
MGLFLIGFAAVAASGCGGSGSTANTTTTNAGAVPFDRAFIDAMVPHHQAAIEMARAAKRAGLSQPELLEIANDIAVTQQREIDEMRAWRQEWSGSSAIDPDGGAALGLSNQEMGMQHAADFSTAHDVDQSFASMMIEHHQGAVQMGNLARERAQHQEIKDLAKRHYRRAGTRDRDHEAARRRDGAWLRLTEGVATDAPLPLAAADLHAAEAAQATPAASPGRDARPRGPGRRRGRGVYRACALTVAAIVLGGSSPPR